MFVWKLVRNMLPTSAKLRKSGLPINGDCPFCCQVEENADHISKECQYVVNISHTISVNCPTPFNTNLGIVDWLEYLWKNISWYKKKFEDLLEKVITMLWPIWNHRNSIVFNGDACNPNSVLELEKNMIYEYRDYKNCYNIPNLPQVAGSKR